MKQKALALALVLCMVIAMLPVSVFAAPVSVGTAPLTAAAVGELAPAAIEPSAKSYSVSLSSSGRGEAELLDSSPAKAGSEFYFMANPDDGYLAEIYYDGLAEGELVYLGADIYGFVMPANKVKLEVKFVKAEGEEHYVSVHDNGRGEYAVSRNYAKKYESVLLAIKPDDSSAFDPMEYVWCVDAALFFLFEEEGIFYFEIIMGDNMAQIFFCHKYDPDYIETFVHDGFATVTLDKNHAGVNDLVTATVIPDPGYRLVKLEAQSSLGHLVTELTPIGNNQYTFLVHPSTTSVHVWVERYACNVTVKAGPGGTARANVAQAQVGDTVTVVCTPDDNYRVASITGVDGLTDNGDNTYTFTMPGHDVSINVSFRKIYNPVAVTVETGIGGSAIASVMEAKLGDTVTLTVTPDEGYRVAQITGVKDLRDNGDGTYTFTMPDEAVELKVLFLRHENPFLDVNETHFFYDPVLWAVEEGITSGMTENTFGPFVVCNRAQVVTFLWRYAGSPEPTTTENPFTDVPAESWFTKPVLWALENGITQGVSPTEFGPELACNRAQVVTFLWRLMQEPLPSLTEHPFTDVEAGSWYEAPVLWALENGITTGATADTFNPVGQCQRAQVVTFLYRTSQLPPPPAVYDLQWNINGFTDTPSEYGTVTLSHTSAQAGETITATVIPAEGYQLDWAKCYFDTPVTQISETEYTFVMPDHEEIFCVNFSEIPVEPTEPDPTEPTEPDPTEPDPTDPTEPEVPVKTYTLDLRDNGNGTVSYVDDKMTAAPGESIFFYAVPNPGYELSNVGIFNPNGEIDVSKIQLFEHGNDLYELVMIDHDIIMTCHFTPIA